MALNEATRAQIGKDLFQALQTAKKIPRISKQYPEIDYDDAYGIQRYMLEEMFKAGYVRSGRKIGLTSKAMRDLVNINEPDYGSIFFDGYFPNGGTLKVDQFVIPRVEVEFAYKLKKGLNKKDITKEDVLDATEFIVCALELIDNRADMDEIRVHDSIADNAAFAGYTFGDMPMDPYVDMRNVGVVVYKNNQQVSTSSGAAVMGDATNGIVWLANKMVELGEPLEAGEYVLAGSVVAAIPAKAGDSFRADFGAFGEVSVHFE